MESAGLKKLVIINSVLVHDQTRNMGLPGVSQYRSKRAKREPLAFLTKTRNTSTTKLNSICIESIILFLQESNACYLLPRLVNPPTCYFLWCGVRLTEFQNEYTYSTIPCSISRPFGFSQSEMWVPVTVTHSHIINDFGIRHTHLRLSHLAKESPRDHLHV